MSVMQSVYDKIHALRDFWGERQDRKAANLDRLAAELVDCEDGEPVAGEGAGANQDGLADGDVAESEVEVFARAEAHCAQERSRGET